jgi:hypothetical protein
MSRKDAADALLLQQLAPLTMQSDLVLVIGNAGDLETVRAGLGEVSGVAIAFADTDREGNKALLGSDFVEQAARGAINPESIQLFRQGTTTPFVKLPTAAAGTLGATYFADRLIGRGSSPATGPALATAPMPGALNQMLRPPAHTGAGEVRASQWS